MLVDVPFSHPDDLRFTSPMKNSSGPCLLGHGGMSKWHQSRRSILVRF